jgi:hypothetical protein
MMGYFAIYEYGGFLLNIDSLCTIFKSYSRQHMRWRIKYKLANKIKKVWPK